jgi:hypothetical protein
MKGIIGKDCDDVKRLNRTIFYVRWQNLVLPTSELLFLCPEFWTLLPVHFVHKLREIYEYSEGRFYLCYRVSSQSLRNEKSLCNFVTERILKSVVKNNFGPYRSSINSELRPCTMPKFSFVSLFLGQLVLHKIFIRSLKCKLLGSAIPSWNIFWIVYI